nr:GapR family DNA-binding domain-containing protein [Ensifer sp. ZNC0028]
MSEFDPLAVSGRMAAAGDDTPAPTSCERPGREVSSNQVARDQLRAFIERIERLEEEKSTIGDDINAVYAEAKATGFENKAIRKIIAIRKKSLDEYNNEMAVLDTYLVALGMLPGGDDD